MKALCLWSALLLVLPGIGAEAVRIVQPREGEVVRVACVGDSITFGSGVEDRAQNHYPAVLGRLLGPLYQVRNFGVSGATLLKDGDLPYWKTPQMAQVREFRPHVIILKLGTNDSKPQNWKHGARFESDLREMIASFRSLESAPQIWLCLPVPVYEARWGINEPVVAGEIAPKIRSVARELTLPLADLHRALSGHPEWFPDKIHPNAPGAEAIARTIFAALTAQIPNLP